MRFLVGGIGMHGPEDRGLAECCLLGFNSGRPIVPVSPRGRYNQNMQFFQTPDHVVVFTEMVHERSAAGRPLGRSHRRTPAPRRTTTPTRCRTRRATMRRASPARRWRERVGARRSWCSATRPSRTTSTSTASPSGGQADAETLNGGAIKTGNDQAVLTHGAVSERRRVAAGIETVAVTPAKSDDGATVAYLDGERRHADGRGHRHAGVQWTSPSGRPSRAAAGTTDSRRPWPSTCRAPTAHLADACQQQLQTDEPAALGFAVRFGLLVDAEWAAREQRKLQRRLRAAKLRHPATLEAVDFTHPRRLNREQVLTLGACAWIAERHNLLLIGPTGIGKSRGSCQRWRRVDLAIRPSSSRCPPAVVSSIGFNQGWGIPPGAGLQDNHR